MTEPSGHGSGELPATVVAAVTTLVVAVVVGVVVLQLNNKPIDGFLTVMAAVVIPSITTLLAIRNSRGIAKVAQRVDGKIDNLITDKSNLEAQVANAGLTPITLKASFDPESNTAPMRKITGNMTNPMPRVDPGGKHSG